MKICKVCGKEYAPGFLDASMCPTCAQAARAAERAKREAAEAEDAIARKAEAEAEAKRIAALDAQPSITLGVVAVVDALGRAKYRDIILRPDGVYEGYKRIGALENYTFYPPIRAQQGDPANWEGEWRDMPRSALGNAPVESYPEFIPAHESAVQGKAIEIDLSQLESKESKVEFANLTPHAVVITAADANTITVEPSGALARCEETREQVGQIAGVPVWSIGMGAVVGLPEPQVGKVYIVSALVMAQVPNRADVFAPGPAIRDDKGRVIGCQGLSATPRAAAHIRRGLPTDGYKVVEIGAE